MPTCQHGNYDCKRCTMWFGHNEVWLEWAACCILFDRFTAWLRA
jgi:hypothetical protein